MRAIAIIAKKSPDAAIAHGAQGFIEGTNDVDFNSRLYGLQSHDSLNRYRPRRLARILAHRISSHRI